MAEATGTIDVPLFARLNGKEIEVGTLAVPFSIGWTEVIGNDAVASVRVGEVTV